MDESAKAYFDEIIDDHGRLQGGSKWAFAPLENGTKNQKFLKLENLKSETLFQLIGVIIALVVHLPV